MSLFYNYPLWSALAGVGLAQFLKIPLFFITHRSWKWGLLFSTGGMPSSHSAAVTALATAIGLTEGFGSSFFAVATVLAIIVMYDAAGVRRHAGQHAALLNLLLKDFNSLKDELKVFRIAPEDEKREQLKELLGHKPIEVLMGATLGIFIALGIGYLIDFF